MKKRWLHRKKGFIFIVLISVILVSFVGAYTKIDHSQHKPVEPEKSVIVTENLADNVLSANTTTTSHKTTPNTTQNNVSETPQTDVKTPTSNTTTTLTFQRRAADPNYVPPEPEKPSLIMSPNVVDFANVYNEIRISLSNGEEISMPTHSPSSYESPEIYLGWYDDARGHKLPGPYYTGWRPLIIRKNVIEHGETLFTVHTEDRMGNKYSTTLKIVW